MTMNVKETVLANGVRVATSAMPSVESVAMGVWVGVGGRYESAGLSGISHFIEHLLFKGTERLSARDISQSIEGRGGYCNAFTQEEMTCYFARVAYDRAWKIFDILAEMYLHPRFDPADIEKERSVILEEIMMYRDQPEHVVHEMLDGILWKDHELGRPLVGTPESLGRLTRDHLLTFKKKKYVPENTVVTFAGRVGHDECVVRVMKLMKRLGDHREPTCKLVTPAVPQERLALKSKDIEQTQLALGFRIFGRFDKRRYALKLLSVILGENMSSRLFQVVREKHGLAYSVHSGIHLFADTGALVVSAGLDRARKEKALELILRELCRLKHEPVSNRELIRAKEYIIGHLRLSLESPSGHMMWMGEHLLNYRTCIPPEDVIQAVLKVQAREVRDVAEAIFKDCFVSLSLLSPGVGAKDGERIQALLKEIG
ncbi:MAG: insulinase family protein [Verrucomicrobia bacterium]|nr:insulinase family protein [Verrucomicrobiota bacterium]MCG2679070.1 insulinase family protein [Kiritimatiellia bacterium]MBU4248405.1 insulinase family protein [Verrucomicrobiota bacterium]MBU4290892.1 insulinase family protein [Verrucomicrobiota bacterium]MBU4428118.1 insulinase family protein [Verrucomicrobiota bacterium]